jgi:hypothetical protein
MEAARGHHFALEDVPEPLRSPELCWEAVRRAGSALQYVPEPLRTSELCLEAVRRTCSALEDVPEALRTLELYLAAARQDGWALQYVPAALRTPELYVAALEQSASIINVLSNDELSTPEVSRWADEHWDAVVQALGDDRAYSIARTIFAAQETATAQAPADRMRG